jgi:hypothetical protein
MCLSLIAFSVCLAIKREYPARLDVRVCESVIAVAAGWLLGAKLSRLDAMAAAVIAAGVAIPSPEALNGSQSFII